MNATSTTARKKLSVQSETLYAETLSAIQSKNWSKLENAINLGTPLYTEIEKMDNNRYHSMLKSAASAKNGKKATNAFVGLVANGISILLKSSFNSASTIKKDIVRQGFSEYLVLEPIFSKVDSQQTDTAKQAFRTALASIDDASKYKSIVGQINGVLDTLVSKV